MSDNPMFDNMKEKTGKDLDEWLAVLLKKDFEKHGQIMSFLKKEQGLTHGYANLIAIKTLEAKQGGPTSDNELVETQYSDDKADLRPIYDALVKEISKFGKDVELAPKKAYVSLRRNKQFGLIQPTTKTRVDVGINMGDAEATERLEKSGSFNSMVSHRVRLSDKKGVDKELIDWLKKAYEQA